MKRFILSIGLILITKLAFAQMTKLDSTKKTLQVLWDKTTSKNRDSLLTETIASIWDQMPYEDFKGLKIMADSLMGFAGHSTYKNAKGIALYVKGRYYFRTGQYSNAMNTALTARDIFEKLNDIKYLKLVNIQLASIVTNSLFTRANVLGENQVKQTLVHIKECENIVNKYGDYIDKTKINLIYAFYYLTIKDYTKSYKYYKSSADIVEKDSATQFYAYYNPRWAQGLSLLYLNKKKEGFNIINRIAKLSEIPRVDQANLLLKHNMNLFMAKYYLENNQLDTAIVLANKANEYSKDKAKFNLFQKASIEILYEAHIKQKHYELANTYLKQLYELSVSDEFNKFNENVSEWQVKYEDEKNKLTIKSLENEKLLETSKKESWLRNFLIFGLLAGLGFLLYFYRNNKKLMAKNQEIVSAMLKGQTIERKRVAQELHDNLSAKISGIRWRLEAIRPNFDNDKAKKVYESSVDALAEIYTDVRLISHNLLPDDLETKGLKVALEKLILELNSLGKTQIKNNISDDLGRFSSKIEYEIYSVILEISNNILKHSKATEASISLNKTNQFLSLSIRDNGIGISENSNQKGMGLANLRSRIQSLKGELEFVNDNGLNVNIKAPIL